jgi:predicted transcriptional regulator
MMAASAVQMPFAAPLRAGTVVDVMHRGLVTCVADMAAKTVARVMAAHRIHAVAVVNDDGHCVCVVETPDIIAAVQRGTLHLEPARAIGRPPIFVDEPTPVREAVRLMHRHGVAHLIVAERGESRPVGIVSILDALDAL